MPTLELPEQPILSPMLFTRSERRVFAKRESLTVSQWAEKYRMVSIGAHRGPWRNDISPHLVKIMDTWNLPYVREVIICKSPQTGGTETMYNCAGYAMDRMPSTMLFIMPSEHDAAKVSADRIIPMINETPPLARLKSPNPDDTAKKRIKFNNGCIVYMAWSNSTSALATFPVKYLFFDEVDKYPPFVGKEADPITLGEKRARTFRYTYKLFKVSTPTREDGPIWTALQSADVLFKFRVRCPVCGENHIMTLSALKYPEDKTTEDIQRDNLATYECPHCQDKWDDMKKEKAVRLGNWHREKGKGLRRPRTVAFHLPSWVSPDVSLSEIAAAYIKAKSNKSKLIDFYNDYLAEPFTESLAGEAVAEDVLYNRRYQYWPKKAVWRVPMKALMLTCAVDVQKSPARLEAEVVAWGEGYESWGIDYRVFPGDAKEQQVWDDLDEYIRRTWLHESGIKMRVQGTAIDAGFLAPYVYKFVRKRQSRRVIAVKGSPVRGKPLISTPSTAVMKKNRVVHYTIGTELAKDMLFDFMQTEAPGPGYMHYHKTYDYKYYKGLTSETGITKYDKSGRPFRIWTTKVTGSATEPLDIRVYSLALLEILNPNMKALAQEMEEQILIKEDKIQPKPKAARRVISKGVDRKKYYTG